MMGASNKTMVDDEKDEGLKLKCGEGNIGILLRLIFICIAIGALSCSIACLGKCNFFIYEPRRPPDGVDDTRPDILLNVSIATIGLFRYDANSEGCRDIPDNFDQLAGAFLAAQIGSSLAVITGSVGLALILVDLICCRFPCGRLLISIMFQVAFIGQLLGFLVYAAPICDPNYLNGPFPCSPDTGTWLAVSACALFLISGCLGCCIPKPLPIVVRVKKSIQDDETDGCCAVFARNPKDKDKDKEQDEEAGAMVATGGVPGETGNTDEEEEIEPTVEQLQADKTNAAVATSLAAVRRGKQEEIEKQLELVTKYKDYIPDEEYEEKVAKLLHALPDPDTYDAFTKTDTILPVEEAEADENEDGDSDMGEEEEEAKDAEKKKGFGSKITTSVGTAVGSVGSAMKAVTGGGSNKSEPQEAPLTASVLSGE